MDAVPTKLFNYHIDCGRLLMFKAVFVPTGTARKISV